MEQRKTFGFETLQIHAGARPDPTTGARQTPVFQNTSYVFKDADHAAALFNLQDYGFLYSRLTNPTLAVLEERLATLEGGIGTTVTASGHSAQILALFPLMAPGRNIVSSNRLYGGSVTQFTKTFQRFGWNARLVDFEDLDAVRGAIDSDTRALFSESLCNPGGVVTDMDAIGAIAESAGLPYIVDNTLASPWLCRPFEHGAALVVHSTTKYLSGNGTTVGGAVIDSGTFNWSAGDLFPSLSEPEAAYHGLVFHETFGELGYTVHAHAVGLRDLGMTQAPFNAFLTLLGIETLSLRMERCCKNAHEIACWLEKHEEVPSVSYAGLDSSPFQKRAQKYLRDGLAGSLLTFRLKGGYEACVRFVDSLELFSHVANLGDARSLVIHAASTTHRQLTDEQRRAAGADPDTIRLSIGLESPEDLIHDLRQALEAAS